MEVKELMLCTFCGTENGPENKFCGMCGVRLERRKAERRIRHESLKCQSCGHVNEPDHKFCGMCGVRVDRRAQERRAVSVDQPRATAMANAQLPTPDSPNRKSAAESLSADSGPTQGPRIETPTPSAEIHPQPPPVAVRNERSRTSSIGGPSFLGLNDEPLIPGEYLLDDEGSSGSVLRKLVLIAFLAVVGILIFVGWRSNWRPFLKSAEPTKSQPAPLPSPQVKNQAGAATGQPRGTENANAGSSQDTSAPAAAQNNEAKNPQALPEGPEQDKTSSTIAPDVRPNEKSDPDGQDRAASAKVKEPDQPSAVQRKPSATLMRAQNYLQGRGGVRQNCEQGLMYLRAAAQKNEPAAAVQMAALYASGHCVQQDRVMAYRWFNSAHELDPANPWIQTNLDQLWAEMTPQQRRQAGQ